MSISHGAWKWWKRRDEFEPDSADPLVGNASILDHMLDSGHYSSETDSAAELREYATGYSHELFGDTTEKEECDMSSLDEAVKQLLSIEGATGAAVVDYTSGMALAQGGNPGFDLGVAAAGNSNVVSAKLRTMSDLNLDTGIEDILITLDSQYHLINVLNSTGSKGLFVYLVLDRTYANLALARHKLKNLAIGITI
ncbi:hypothetical protein AAHB33_10335 [Paenarthrobacter sp. S56]|uniref:hypothetical protein n=1 Tax=Paenarthrobacter sp. S56 TaxID=3138179 RepID=UPI003219F4C9